MRHSASWVRLMVACFALGAPLLSGCQSAYYGLWEKVGVEKRDLLKSNVNDVKEEQAEAREQFQDALTRLRAQYGSQNTPLEKIYDTTKSEYEESLAHAEDFRERIEEMDDVAEDLFDEWEDEIPAMRDAGLRQKSREKLAQTRTRYARLLQAVQASEKSMEPVLAQLQDQTIFLKHNLNAQALGTLEREMRDIEQGIGRLMADMDKAVRSADAFLRSLEQAS